MSMDYIDALVDSCKPLKKRGRPSHKRQLQDIRLEKRVNLQTSDSVVAVTNLKSILTLKALQSLPSQCQHRLVSLLPEFDQIQVTSRSTSTTGETNDRDETSDPVPVGQVKASDTALTNEYFVRFCAHYQDKLKDNLLSEKAVEQAKLDTSKELAKLDPWKLRNYEPIWGKKLPSQILDQ